MSERIVHRGQRFDLYEATLVGDDGQSYVREVVRHPGAVIILPLIDADTVVMIENTRWTVDETLLELPAGTREDGEEPEVSARRELIEETGYCGEDFRLTHEFYSAPGISDELMYLYQATNLTLGQPDREATEQIVTRIASRNEVRQWIEGGKIRDAKTLVGLYSWLASNP